MSDLHLAPDPERVAVDFLLAQPELAALVADRVYTVLPGAVEWPAVRVVRWGGWAVMSRPLWLDECWCQVDCWADRKAEAFAVATLCRALVSARLARSVPECSGVRFGMMIDSPDPSYNPAKPHWRFDLALYLHPPVAAPPVPRRPAAPAALTP